MELSVQIERWPLAGAFTISRGSKTEAVVVRPNFATERIAAAANACLMRATAKLRTGVVAAIEAMRPALRNGLDRAALQAAMPAGAARNALDCAYWDLNAKQTGRRVHELAGLAAPKPRVTAYTISLAAPAAMAEAAERAASRPLLKVKLGGGDDDDGQTDRRGAARRATSSN